LTVLVASFFELVLRDHSKDHAVAVAYSGDTLTAEPSTTLRVSTPAAHPADRRNTSSPRGFGAARWTGHHLANLGNRW